MGDVRLEDWLGRSRELVDQVHPTPVRACAVTLDDAAAANTQPGDPLPELWHWLYFLPMVPMAEIGADGHPKRGGFLPPIALDRRMWAGGRLIFHEPLRIGDDVRQRSEIVKIVEKEGKAGRMVFVTVRHEVSSARGLAVEEEQDIVYVAMPKSFTPPAPVPAPADPGWSEPVAVDPVLLFRFSAVTFNGHRIHYDRTYARQEEFYPGLVVHGPLQATLLVRLAARTLGRMPAEVSYRGVSPLFDGDRLVLEARRSDEGLSLRAANGAGATTMEASAR